MVGEILSKMLSQGVIMLADGPAGNILSFTPPFYMKLGELVFVVETLRRLLDELKLSLTERSL